MLSVFSTRSSPRKRRVPAWDCASAGELSSLTAGACEQVPIQDGAQPFTSRCLPARRTPHLLPHRCKDIATAHMSPEALLAGYRYALARFYSLRSISRRLSRSPVQLFWTLPLNLAYA